MYWKFNKVPDDISAVKRIYIHFVTHFSCSINEFILVGLQVSQYCDVPNWWYILHINYFQSLNVDLFYGILHATVNFSKSITTNLCKAEATCLRVWETQRKYACNFFQMPTRKCCVYQCRNLCSSHYAHIVRTVLFAVLLAATHTEHTVKRFVDFFAFPVISLILL